MTRPDDTRPIDPAGSADPAGPADAAAAGGSVDPAGSAAGGRKAGGAVVRKVLICCFWIAVWQVASMLVGSGLLLPGPVETVAALVRDLGSGAFWSCVGFSIARIAVGFTCAFVLAVVLAVCSWRVRAVRELLEPVVLFVKAVPVVCIIVLLLMWAGSAQVSVLAVGLMVFPPVYYSCLEGLGQTDRATVEALCLLGVGTAARLRHYHIPQLMPYITSASRVVVGIAWKSGIAAEVIGIPAGSIGAGIYAAKITLETADLFAWTLAVVALSVVCEKAFLALLGVVGKWSRRVGPAGAGSAAVRTGSQDQGGREDRDDWEGWENQENQGSTATAARRAVRFELEDVWFAYDGPAEAASDGFAGAAVLEGLTFAVDPGERVCVMGPSGIGKTTLLGVLCGLHKPTQGTLTREGDLDAVGCSFQDNLLLEGLSAWDNVLLVARGRRRVAGACGAGRACGPEGARDLGNLKGMLDELLGCDSATLLPSQLSGGMRRKVALVRALAAPGGLVVLDEPFAGLDEVSRAAALACVADNLDGRTLFLATHDERDTAALGCRVIALGSRAGTAPGTVGG